MSDVIAEVRGSGGFITLNRPQALNALSLQMIRELTAALLEWRDDDRVERVALRGMGRQGPFGAFCAGGDIRFFHQAVLAGDPRLEDFFTEEYTLNHLIHGYPKPYIVFLDGIVMGGGMGISAHGGDTSLRIVTERTKMAMPETNIGLFPDVGGGWFLSRTPGRLGEYLGLTGAVIHAADALHAGLADAYLPGNAMAELVDTLRSRAFADGDAVLACIDAATAAHRGVCVPAQSQLAALRDDIDRLFAGATVTDIVAAVSDAGTDWAAQTAAMLRGRSPLMLNVTLEQIRRARTMTLEDELRMELDMMYYVFRHGDGVEGIRALAVDKDHAPKWQPPRLDEVSRERVRAFFDSPWAHGEHPLAAL